MAEKKIEDFGEKIEGARKDLSALRKGIMELTSGMIEGWTDKEQEQYINKDLVWKRPDYQQMVDDGMDKRLAYFVKLVRDALPARPQIHSEEGRKGYAEFIHDVRDRAMQLKVLDDITDMKNDLISKYLDKSGYRSYTAKRETYGCFQTKLMRALQSTARDLENGVTSNEFCYSEKEHLMHTYIQGIFSPSQYDRMKLQKNDYGRNTSFSYGYLDIYLTEKKGFHDTIILRLQEPKTHQCPDMTEADFEHDKYYVISKNNELLFGGIATKEEAESLALEWARQAEQAKNPSKGRNGGRSKAKEKLLPPQLEHIRRTGDEHRENGLDVSGEDILECFKLRGGQFGNWTNQNDRQTNMNMLFDAFRDLAVALNISYEDIALKQQSADDSPKRTASLGIAWGARGHSGALAHYEPVENVINLTKMRGAGSLAHEWGHALDCFIKESLNMTPSPSAEKAQKHLATHCIDKDNPFAEVIRAMHFRQEEGEDGRLIPTEFYKESKKADGSFAKTDNGYWVSNCEMFARAFACYVEDKLREKSIRCDYLTGHADYTVYPRGEERKAIGEAIDRMIDDIKVRGLLHHQEHDIPAEMKKAPAPLSHHHDDYGEPQELQFGEQMSLFDMMDDAENEIPTKQEVEAAPAAAEMPAPKSQEKAAKDITSYASDFMPHDVTFDYEGRPTIRIEANLPEDMSLDEKRELVERAGVTNSENAEHLAHTMLKLYFDFDENGTSGVLESSYGIMKIKEFNITLTDSEKQSAEQAIERLVGHSSKAELESVKTFAETLFDEKLEDREYDE